MTEYDIVNKIIGEIEPVGESNEDSRRYSNLEKTCELVDKLMESIIDVTPNRNRHESSISDAGKYAYRFLRNTYLIMKDVNWDEDKKDPSRIIGGYQPTLSEFGSQEYLPHEGETGESD